MPIRPKPKGRTTLARWTKLELPFHGKIALANVSQLTVGILPLKTGLFIGVEGRGAYEFGGFVHWNYAMTKLNLHQGDAENLADFLNAQLGHDENLQGRYTEELCR